MRRILLLTVRADHGGGPKHLLCLLKKLHTKYSLYVASPKDWPYFSSFSKYAKCFVIPHRQFSFWHLCHLYYEIRRNKIDIIHSHGKGAGIYSRPLGLLTGKPVVHTFHGFYYRHLPPVRRQLYLLFERVFAGFTQLFINVSASEHRECLDACLFEADKSRIIHNGVEIPPFKEKYIPNGMKLLNVSRLSPEKGIDILLRIMKIMFEKTTDFHLNIVGDGPEMPRLQKMADELGIAQQVSFLGFMDDVSEEYAKADIYVTASRGEGLPITILEAMANSLPVVASDVIGNRDLVDNGETGFLFDLEKPETAAEMILRVMDDKNCYQRLSKNGYQLVSKNFSLEKMCKRIEDIYDKLLKMK